MSRSFPLTDDEHTLVLQWSRQHISLAEQARRLSRPVSNLAGTRRELALAGLIAVHSRPPRRAWTAAEREQLGQLIDTGHSYDAIAEKLGRSRKAIILECKRRNRRLLKTRALLTAGQVADLLGKPCSKTVSRWITLGLLKARNAGTPKRPFWRIALDDLRAFMQNENTWMAWQPAAISDPDLHAWALELRRNESRWLSVGEVARRYHVVQQTVNQWIEKAELKAVKYGNHWIRECDLAGWVPPHARSRAVSHSDGWPRDNWIEVGRTRSGCILRRRAA
jgi:excisionase family DNA binding protein